jgi:NAD(P)-dependent dehydrogenase (short-subunit alcohol dehydrogenase family)
MNPFDLSGQTALVTGGGTGIGLGVARCLVASGARVVITGRRADVLQNAATDISGDVIGMALDVTDPVAVAELVAAVERDVGPLDILVNNAGNHVKAPAEEMPDEDFRSALDVHLGGGFSITREAGGRMLARGRGSVVFVGSLNAFIGMPQVVGYSAAKAGVMGMVRALAVEWASRGVRVNGVVPGWIDAGIAKRVLDTDAERRARVLARTPMGRLGSADDVGWAVVYLCTPAAGFVTGTALHIDGGAAIGF